MKNRMATAAAALLLVSLSAAADTTIAREKLPTYQDAASVALRDMPINSCNDYNGSLEAYRSDAENIIGSANSGILADLGKQPTLTLMEQTQNDSQGHQTRAVVEVFSSADGRSAVEFIILDQVLLDVNNGTLTDPMITQQWITQQSFDCK